jgi:hypothetical protein
VQLRVKNNIKTTGRIGTPGKGSYATSIFIEDQSGFGLGFIWAAELAANSLSMPPSALRPVSRIDFARLWSFSPLRTSKRSGSTQLHPGFGASIQRRKGGGCHRMA